MTSKTKKVLSYFAMPLLAMGMALSYELFVFPNAFAPAGVGGIATMIQHVFKFNAGYLNLVINIPLLLVAWFLTNREFVIKTAIFTLVFSGGLLLLGKLDFTPFLYHTDNGTSTILGPIAAGVVNGLMYGLAVRLQGSSGGTDVVAAMVRQAKPEYNMVWIVFAINAVIAISSYFVYDFKFEPVICCLVYCFVNSTVADWILRGSQSALKYEIITNDAEAMGAELLEKLKHGVTVVSAEGLYTHKDKSLVICIVNKHQIEDVRRIIEGYPGSFAYVSSVNGTVGRFAKVK